MSRVRSWVAGLAIAAAAFLLSDAAAEAQLSGQQWYTVTLAASHNDVEQVLALLLQGDQDADGVDSQGRTPLDYAASFNNPQMALVLLDHGAHVDGRDRAGDTALHWAAERGNLEVMRFLIARGATVDAANRQGTTPLIVAVQHVQPAAVRLLVEKGADPHKQDFTGRDALGWAKGRPNIIQALNARR